MELDYSKLNIEDLILNEGDIDWDKFSVSRKNLSLAEVRLFRSKIKWNKFFLKGGTLDHEQLKIASKYFNKPTYDILSHAHWVSQSFITEEREYFNWRSLIRSVYLTPKTISDSLDAIISQINNVDELKEIFESALFFNIHEQEYEEVLLYLNLV